MSISDSFQSSQEELEAFANIFRLTKEHIRQAEIAKLTPLQRAKYYRWSKGTIHALFKLKKKIDS